jgi:hypothetical protein
LSTGRTSSMHAWQRFARRFDDRAAVTPSTHPLSLTSDATSNHTHHFLLICDQQQVTRPTSVRSPFHPFSRTRSRVAVLVRTSLASPMQCMCVCFLLTRARARPPRASGPRMDSVGRWEVMLGCPRPFEESEIGVFGLYPLLYLWQRTARAHRHVHVLSVDRLGNKLLGNTLAAG